MNDWVQLKIFISNFVTGGIKYGSIYNFESFVSELNLELGTWTFIFKKFQTFIWSSGTNI